MSTNNQIEEKFNHEDTNNYNFPELDYYKPDGFNQPDNFSDGYHIKDIKEYECWHCRSHYPSNNKLYSYLQKDCNRLLNNSISQKKYDITHVFGSITDVPTNPKSINTSQDISIQNIRIIHSTINFFVNIETGYGFSGHYYLKDKIALSLLSSINLVYFDISCSVILYDITFFCTQASNMLI